MFKRLYQTINANQNKTLAFCSFTGMSTGLYYSSYKVKALPCYSRNSHSGVHSDYALVGSMLGGCLGCCIINPAHVLIFVLMFPFSAAICETYNCIGSAFAYFTCKGNF